MQRFLGTWEGTCPSRRCPAPTDSGLRSFASTSRRGCRGIRHPAAGRGWRARMVDVAAGNGDVLCSLERRRSAGAAACLRCPPCHARWPDRGHAREDWPNRPDRSRRCARRRRWTDCTASTGDCWCACNRILSPTHHRGGAQRAAGALVARGAGRPAPSGGDACRAVVVVQASRGAAVRCGRCSRARARARTGACACAGARIKTRTKPEPKPEPKRDSEWPTELAFVLETSDRMSSQPNKRGGLSRTAIGRGEIQRIVGRLPKDTDTQLFTFPAGECRSPVGHGVFPAQKRPDLLKTVQGAPDDGKPPWSKASRWRRHPWTASSATPWFSCSWEVRTRAARTSART